jgi:hypothetical protein
MGCEPRKAIEVAVIALVVAAEIVLGKGVLGTHLNLPLDDPGSRAYRRDPALEFLI